MAWFLVYLFNLRLPLLVVSGLGIGLCIMIGVWSSQSRSRYNSGTADHDAAVWRQMTSLKIAVMLSVLCALSWAIPAPDYDVRYVDRPVQVEVVKWKPIFKGQKIVYDSYKDLYEGCIAHTGDYADADETKLCHKQAIEASRPAPRWIKQIKTVTVHDTYKTLFDNCNDFSLDGVPNAIVGGVRNERLAICHKAALEGSSAH